MVTVFFLGFGMSFGSYSQNVVLDIKLDVLLFKARKIRFKQIAVALVNQVGLEFGKI